MPLFGEAALEPVLSCLDEVHDDDDCYYALCDVLSQLGVKDDRIFDVLCDLFEENVELGAMCLASYGDSRALEILEEELRHMEPDLRNVFGPHALIEVVAAHRALGGVLPPELDLRVKRWFAQAEAFRRTFKPKIGRNDLCVCGSGKKYKKCCISLAP
jgi:hypothetical protein